MRSVFLFEGEEDLLIGTRKGSPLAVGYGKKEMFFGSDALALAPFTSKITYLEEGDIAVVRSSSVEFPRIAMAGPWSAAVHEPCASDLSSWTGATTAISWPRSIHEQPDVVGKTLAAYL